MLMILEWVVYTMRLSWIYAERELLSVSIMVKRAISSQKNQVTELLNYATMYNDISLWLHIEFVESGQFSYEMQIAEQFSLFQEYMWCLPHHIDVHKDIPNDQTHNAIIAYANYYDIPMRNKWGVTIPYKHTDWYRYLWTWKLQQELVDRLYSLEDNHTYEIVFHPWIYDPQSWSTLNKGREDDVLMIKRLHKNLSQFSIQRISQHDIN